MGIQQQDPEYLRAKHAFIRDLIQFHEARGTGLSCDPKINGKEIDLYLLYQIVTSHGGWEKINLRNEWDKLLEHFHFARSTNGGVAIKQIYLRYLELYEKIHYLGEDVDTKEEAEDEYEDFRGRRRYPNKLSHHSSSHHSHHSHHTQPPKEVTEHNRSQLGLSSRLLKTSDYEGLLLSLQSPLPNEQDMAISVCTLLSNETKHVLRFSKSPAILNMLLAHAGIYQDCGMRHLMEETYKDARDMDYAEFWDDVLHQPDARQLLCECFVKRVHSSLGLTDDEGAILSQIQEIEAGDFPEEEKFALGTALRLKLKRLRELRDSDSPTSTPNDSIVEEKEKEAEQNPSSSNDDDSQKKADQSTEEDRDSSAIIPESEAEKEKEGEAEGIVKEGEEKKKEEEEKKEEGEKKEEEKKEEEDDVEIIEGPPEPDPLVKIEPPPRICCSICPCERLQLFGGNTSNQTSIEDGVEVEDEDEVLNRRALIHNNNNNHFNSKIGRPRVMADEAADGPHNSLPFTLSRSHHAGDKVGQRICQIAHILRNLSFEQDNALVMAKSPTLMRFVLVAANCTFGSLAQDSFDIIGNISSYIHLEEPLRDPLSSMLLTLITSGVFSADRFKILRSLEAIRELSKVEGNESILTRYVESRVYRRMCDILTLSDIMLLIYTLECMLSMSGLGEQVCDEIVRVQGSVATLVSLVTVEAQSYGPKGCILMRVVETVTGATSPAATPSSSSTTTTTSSSSVAASAVSQGASVAAVATAIIAGVSGSPLSNPPTLTLPTAVTPPPPCQQLLQQQLQQPPNPIYSPSATPVNLNLSRPSPATSPSLKIVSGTTTVVPPVIGGGPAPRTAIPLTANSQVFSNPASNLLNHLNSPTHSALSTTSALHHYPFQQQQQQQQQFAPSVHSMTPVGSVVVPKPSALPSTLPSPLKPITTNGADAMAPVGPSQGQPLPGGTTTVVVQQTKSGNLVAVAPATAAAVNGAPGLLPQIANHSLNQQHHVVTPSISLVTPRGTLSEEAWAIAWLKGTFEASSGTSIEQGEIYRMYSAARKNPNVVLSLEQFVKCVQCAYSTSVGPVIKKFGGGTSLSFFEGIKPKIAIRAVAMGPGAQAHLQAAATAAGALKPGANAIINVTGSVPGLGTATVVTVSNPISSVTAAATMVVASVSQTQTPTLPSQPQVSQQQLPLAAPQPQPQTMAPPQPLPPQTQTVMNPPAAPSPVPQAGESNLVLESGSISNNNNNNNNNGSGGGATLPVSVHIPSREAKPSLSPILQATLSQPPKAKNNNVGGATSTVANAAAAAGGNNNVAAPSKRSLKKRKKEHSSGTKHVGKGRPGGADTNKGEAASGLCHKFPLASPGHGSKGKSSLSPASSAIRSLLASKVVQRQQNKLQQQLPTVKNSLGAAATTTATKQNKLVENNRDDSVITHPSSEIVKVNGIGPEEKSEETSSSLSSVLSGEFSDGILSNKTQTPITSFHGALHNGQTNLDLKNELNFEGVEDPESLKNRGQMKGMLIDLLERRVPSREPVNGIITGREIRISEKGLELIDKMDETIGNSGAAESSGLANHHENSSSSSSSVGATTTSTTTGSNEVQESQKMTFYSSTSDAQVTLQGQAPSACVIPTVGTVLSGGTSNTVTLRTSSAILAGQQLASLKRPSSPLPPGNTGNNNEDCPPPAKKPAMESQQIDAVMPSTIVGQVDAHTAGTVQQAQSQQMQSQVQIVTSAGTIQPAQLQGTISTTAAVSTTGSLPPGAGAQVVQLPLRLSVNPQNPQQLTFTRQLMLPSGQQLLLSTGSNTQSALQGQVIISKPQGTASDQMPKAIIILQQPNQQSGTSSASATVVTTAVTTTQNTVQVQQQQPPGTIRATTTPVTVQHQPQLSVAATIAGVGGVSQSVATSSLTTSQITANSLPSVISSVGALQQQQQLHTFNQTLSPQMGNAANARVVPAAQASHQTVQNQVQVRQVVAGQLQAALHPQQHQQQVLQHHLQQHPSIHLQQHFMQKQHGAHFEGIRASSYPHLTQDQLDLEFPSLCEWAGCGLRFLRPSQVIMHALSVHCPETMVDAVKCEWGQNGCDPLLRKRFSLMTHLQDRHCSKQALEMALYRRKNKIEPPPVPQQPVHHPGYAPNAALHAIKRHAMSFMSAKDHLHDDNEGPVTKSIRLTSALILRNLVNYSALGRRMLHGYESHLSAIAMSNVESSRTIAQLLHDMNDEPKSSKC